MFEALNHLIGKQKGIIIMFSLVLNCVRSHYRSEAKGRCKGRVQATPGKGLFMLFVYIDKIAIELYRTLKLIYTPKSIIHKLFMQMRMIYTQSAGFHCVFPRSM